MCTAHALAPEDLITTGCGLFLLSVRVLCERQRQHWDWNSNSVVRLLGGVNFQVGQMSEVISGHSESMRDAHNLRARQAVDKCVSISSYSRNQADECPGENDYEYVQFHPAREANHRKRYAEALLDRAV